MTYSLIEIDEPKPRVRRISLNRPEKRNALNHTLRGDIIRALQEHDKAIAQEVIAGDNKVDELDKMIAVRDLKSSTEGCAKGTWPSPESMGATFGTAMEISLAGDAVIALVREIKKIK